MDEGALFRGANAIEFGSSDDGDERDGDEDCDDGCGIHEEEDEAETRAGE
jgi:hypothetical protein